jgi:uncharacterized coiled-coil DUF342 family protein
MKKRLQAMETQQQTTQLSNDKEKKLVKAIATLAKEIQEKEKSFEGDEELRTLYQQLHEEKAAAEAAHKLVSEAAEKAQAAHERMLSLYKQADEIRKQADAAQQKFVETKQAADEEHRLHIEQIKNVHEISKSAGDIKNKKKAAGKKKADIASKHEAEKIFEKFKAGEKLSTEDLMTLQKSGYL